MNEEDDEKRTEGIGVGIRTGTSILMTLVPITTKPQPTTTIARVPNYKWAIDVSLLIHSFKYNFTKVASHLIYQNVEPFVGDDYEENNENNYALIDALLSPQHQQQQMRLEVNSIAQQTMLVIVADELFSSI